jgi:DNA-binding MarR family transcriptional regulator
MAAVTSVIRAQRIFMDRVEAALRPFDLSFARYELLMVLLFSRTGELPLGKLGSRLQVHPTSVTNAVDRLERQGLIERVAHPTDGRTTLAAITKAGRRLTAETTDVLNAAVFADVGLTNSRTEELCAILAMLRREAGDFET